MRGLGDFKPGMVVVSSTVALNMALAPVFIFGWGTGVAGQTFGARRGDRVRATFRTAAALALGGMAVLVAICQAFPAALIRAFSTDPAVVAVGEEYLRIVSWNYLAAGLVFVVVSVLLQAGLGLYLLRREFGLRLPAAALTGDEVEASPA